MRKQPDERFITTNKTAQMNWIEFSTFLVSQLPAAQFKRWEDKSSVMSLLASNWIIFRAFSNHEGIKGSGINERLVRSMLWKHLDSL